MRCLRNKYTHNYWINITIITKIFIIYFLMSKGVFRQSDGGNMKMLGILKLKSFNLAHCLFNVKMFIFTTFCPIFYIAC
jgi:hypothetical protein